MQTETIITVRELNAYAIALEYAGHKQEAKEVRNRVLALVAQRKTEICIDADPEFGAHVKKANRLLTIEKMYERR